MPRARKKLRRDEALDRRDVASISTVPVYIYNIHITIYLYSEFKRVSERASESERGRGYKTGYAI